MAEGLGMSGHNFDAFVSSQRSFNDHDWAAKIQESYWRARQKFLAKVEKNEDACIVLSDSKLDSKLEVYRSIDKSCAKLINILESYQNCLFVLANEQNSLGILLKQRSKHDKTKAGKIMAIAGKSLTQASHQQVGLYAHLSRLYQEMETFHSRAVEDTAETVDQLETRRAKYRSSLLWMKDISEKLDPDVYRKLDRFRRVQSQVKNDKIAFDHMAMNVVQKIDLLMASRCNLMNQMLAPYQATLLETFEKDTNNFRSVEKLIQKEDVYEYEFKALKQLNPLQPVQEEDPSPHDQEEPTPSQENNNNDCNNNGDQEELVNLNDEPLLDLDQAESHKTEESELVDQLKELFGNDESKLNLKLDDETLPKDVTHPSHPKDLLIEPEEEMMDHLEKLFGLDVSKSSPQDDAGTSDGKSKHQDHSQKNLLMDPAEMVIDNLEELFKSGAQKSSPNETAETSGGKNKRQERSQLDLLMEPDEMMMDHLEKLFCKNDQNV